MLTDTLAAIARAPDDAQIRPLGQLIKQLRPLQAQRTAESAFRVESLTGLLRHQPDQLAGLRRYIDALLLSRRHMHLYIDAGMPGSEGLGAGLWRRLNERLLPPAPDDTYLDDAFSRLIRRGRDADWIEAVPDDTWAALLDLLMAGEHDAPVRAHIRLEQLDALRVLAHRICAIGLEPELVRNYPAIEEVESPFLALANETERFVQHQRELLSGLRDDSIDHVQIPVLMAQCEDVLQKIRRQAAHQGVSISLTWMLVRQTQMLERMGLLLDFVTGDPARQALNLARFIKLISRAERDNHSLRALFSRNTELLARNITEHASETGDHYVTTTPAGFVAMWRSAGKAGIVVAVMALLKTLASRLALAPLGQAFVYSMNYSLGFMFIHVIHGTIATKQPAMTASHIAASLEDVPDRRAERHLGRLALLCVDVFRSQFIAILGNVCLAFPVALLIALVWQHVNGSGPAGVIKAQHLMHELDPIHSLALFHAAIAGVFLFLAGIISGYYDNQALYARIPERVAAHPWLRRLSAARRQRIATYLRHNLGALAGNFYFGIMLGSMGTVGYILGLPLDIRHISFSSANFAYALVGLNFDVSWESVIISLLGIAAIGVVNLGVSFSLALMLALKSRGVRFRLWLPLLKLILQHLRYRPRDFFWPGEPPARETHPPE